MGCLYKLTSPSGKSYIGISLFSVEKRCAEHQAAARKGVRTALYAAIRRYGFEQFAVAVLAESDSWPALCEMERASITEHVTLAPSGYNMTTGGDGVNGIPPQSRELHRQKSSEAGRRGWTPERRARRAASFATDEFKARHSEATSRGTALAYQRQELRDAVTASRSMEYRAKVSASVADLWKQPEYRANQIARRRDRAPRSEESIRRQSDRMRELIAARKAAGTYWR